jgi:hypothetical protein
MATKTPDVKYMLRMKAAWMRHAPAALTALEKQTPQDRINRAIYADAPAQGSHMARRDFQLPPGQLTIYYDSLWFAL